MALSKLQTLVAAAVIFNPNLPDTMKTKDARALIADITTALLTIPEDQIEETFAEAQRVTVVP